MLFVFRVQGLSRRMAEVLWTLLVLLLFCLEFWKLGSVLLTAEVVW